MNVHDVLDKNKIQVFSEKGTGYIIRCLNPEHTDNNPSMQINKHTGVFYCFSCGFKGNIFTKYNEQKPSKVNFMADKCLDLLNTIKKEDGLDMPGDAEYFDKSYRNISAQTLCNAEMFMSDILPNHFIFPLYDISGTRTLFIGRSLDLEETRKKYVFHPRNITPTPYPLHLLTADMQEVYVVEGIFDVLALRDIGVNNSLCLFGVGGLKEDLISTLKILGINSIIDLMDYDAAGEKASEGIKKTCDANMLYHYRPEIPEDMEPFKDVGSLKRVDREKFINEISRNRGEKE